MNSMPAIVTSLQSSNKRMTNWAAYNESLRNRGDFTIWFIGDAQSHWTAPRRGSRGGQARYSDLAITLCMEPSMVYRLLLHQHARGGASFILIWTFAAGDIILRPMMLGMRRH